MALIPPFFLDCVVAIGFETPDGKRRYAATGFLYGKFLHQEGDSRAFQVFLVTNRHVFEGGRVAWLRFNPEGEEDAREFELQLVDAEGKKVWLAHQDADVDLAVIGINAPYLRDSKIRFSFFQSDKHVIGRARALELGVAEGDGIYVLGFPMGIIGEKRNFVIVRQGVIARIRDALTGSGKEFLADVTIFPGNSGGPVVSRPEITAIEGTKSSNAAYLIGIVSSYVPYQDMAISTQTNRPRIIFEENSGLAAVVPADFLIEIVDAAVAEMPAQREQTPIETKGDQEQSRVQ